jgi:hypothetical protein
MNLARHVVVFITGKVGVHVLSRNMEFTLQLTRQAGIAMSE